MTSAFHKKYQSFRQQVFNNLGLPPEHFGIIRFSDRKQSIIDFRDHLLKNQRKYIEGKDKLFFQRGLGLPDDYESSCQKQIWPISKVTEYLMRSTERWEFACNQAARATTYQGRDVIYTYHTQKVFNLGSYTPEVDFALTRLDVSDVPEEERLGYVPKNDYVLFGISINELTLPWLKSAFCVGYRNLSEILGLRKGRIDREYAEKVYLITHSNMKGSLIGERSDIVKLLPERWRPDSSLSADEAKTFKSIAEDFVSRGVGLTGIAKLIEESVHRVSQYTVRDNLKVLGGLSGEELTALYLSSPSDLLSGETKIWQDLVDIGVEPAYLGQCKPFFLERLGPNLDVANKLSRLAIKNQDLVACVPLLQQTIHTPKELVMANIDKLVTEYGYTVVELAGATKYLVSTESIDPVFSLLAKFNISKPKELNLFQPLFRDYLGGDLNNIDNAVLVRKKEILSFTTRHLNQSDVSDIAELSSDIAKSFCFESLLFLEKEGLLRGCEDIRYCLDHNMARLLLEYLVSYREYTAFSKIKAFYRSSRGGTTLGGGLKLNHLERVLLDRCYSSRNFLHFFDNRSKVIDYVHSEQAKKDGIAPDTEAFAHKYGDKLATMININHGILFPGLPNFHGSKKEQEDYFSNFSVILDCLLKNNDSKGSVEDVKRVVTTAFRVDPKFFSDNWARLNLLDAKGGENGLAQKLSVRKADFPLVGYESAIKDQWMPWFRETMDMYEFFSKSYREDMVAVCARLQPKKCNNDAYQYKELSNHLGMLLAFVSTGEQVINCLRAVIDASDNIRLTTAISSLNDVLDNISVDDDIVCKLKEESEAVLLNSIAKGVSSEQPPSLVDVMQGFLALSVRKLRRGLSLIEKSLKKQGVERFTTTLKAVVSAEPAAFFARKTFDLCTSNDLDMWFEDRHGHMLIFYPDSPLIVGMAMLYVEEVNGAHSLIIRQLMVSNEILSSFSIPAIVDAFLVAAKSLVVDNDLAALVVPEEIGVNLLSNNPDIHGELNGRCKQLEPCEHKFYGFSEKDEDKAVQIVYTVYTNPARTMAGEEPEATCV